MKFNKIPSLGGIFGLIHKPPTSSICPVIIAEHKGQGSPYLETASGLAEFYSVWPLKTSPIRASVSLTWGETQPPSAPHSAEGAAGKTSKCWDWVKRFSGISLTQLFTSFPVALLIYHLAFFVIWTNTCEGRDKPAITEALLCADIFYKHQNNSVERSCYPIFIIAFRDIKCANSYKLRINKTKFKHCPEKLKALSTTLCCLQAQAMFAGFISQPKKLILGSHISQPITLILVRVPHKWDTHNKMIWKGFIYKGAGNKSGVNGNHKG